MVSGSQHTKQRKMLNPVFSPANMRELLPTIQPIAGKLLATLVSQLPSDGGL
jgi:cytochrome P450